MVNNARSNEERLKFKAVSPDIHNKLSDVDMNRRRDACHALLDTFLNTTRIPLEDSLHQ
jgi:hypothetical protein